MDDQVITAIPTLYSGVNFKSRLEARFAEYLDSVPVKWEYEPKWLWGSYQPDFYLYQYDFYIEIKPKSFKEEIKMFYEEIEKCPSIWMAIDQPERGVWRAYLTQNVCEGRFRLNTSTIEFQSEYYDQRNDRVCFVLDGRIYGYIRKVCG